jgi:hypothetical protein
VKAYGIFEAIIACGHVAVVACVCGRIFVA